MFIQQETSTTLHMTYKTSVLYICTSINQYDILPLQSYSHDNQNSVQWVYYHPPNVIWPMPMVVWYHRRIELPSTELRRRVWYVWYHHWSRCDLGMLYFVQLLAWMTWWWLIYEYQFCLAWYLFFENVCSLDSYWLIGWIWNPNLWLIAKDA